LDRSKSNNLVSASADSLRNAPQPFQLVVPPEGTRSKTRYWKTGFYYIALEAKAPIVMAYMDYSRKLSGLGPIFHPTGDVEKDMADIKAFYAPFKQKRANLNAAVTGLAGLDRRLHLTSGVFAASRLIDRRINRSTPPGAWVTHIFNQFLHPGWGGWRDQADHNHHGKTQRYAEHTG
jgi:hypothetical protein